MMFEVLDTGIASGKGDCIENVALPSKQAEVSVQQNQYGDKPIVPSFNRHQVDFNSKSFPGVNYSQGDQPEKYLEKACLCCRRQFERPSEPKKPIRVMYWEIPKPKFGGISVTADDYKAHKLPKREVPAWHPHRAQPWTWLAVPSITETTYRKDFAPPSLASNIRKLPLRTRNMNTRV